MAASRREANKAQSSNLLTIGATAKLLGVAPATLRNWDKSGKFEARRHPVNGYRLYEGSQVEALREASRGITPEKTGRKARAAAAPYYSKDGIGIYWADAREKLQELRDRTFQCCVTGPPLDAGGIE